MKTLPSTIALFLLINTIGFATTAGTYSNLPGELKNRSVTRDTAGMITQLLYQPSLEKEGYVDDIPFDTNEISTGFLVASLKAKNQEAYIDDIPFNTALIAKSKPASFTVRFENEAEQYVNDIPFNTKKIAEKYLHNGNCRVVCNNLKH